ncbi:SHOCT domain-containing protein [Peribacillus frigoritolerans]|uniref:SHOCT domain-containing protein n=1 Tax=Peribacillus frigoritolerans TaxID=450367 RepID=UPI00300834D3
MDTIEETIKLAGWGRKKAMRKQIEMFVKELLESEDLLGVAASHPNPTEQLYISNKRMIAHKIEGIFENKRVEIPLSSISSINTSVKGLSASIEIIASNNSASVEKMYIYVAREIKKLVDSLINRNSSHETPNDVTDQIKKLADLRDSGILIEEEFKAKKSKLLGI